MRSVASAASCWWLLLPVAAQQPTVAAAFDTERLGRVERLLSTVVADGHHAGASYRILHRDGVVAEGAFGVRDLTSKAPMQLDTIVRIYSMSKLVTAVAALQLLEAGRFELSTPIARFLPELGSLQVFRDGTAEQPGTTGAERPITVRMLLNHTAGFTYDFFRESPVHELYRRKDLWRAASLDAFVQKVATLPLLAQPGSGYHYSIADDVLGALIERASGEPLADYVREHITAPLRMTDTGFDVEPANRPRLAGLATTQDGALAPADAILGSDPEPGRGFASGGGGMFSTLSDYSRLLQMILHDGELDGARILGRKTLELAVSNTLTVEQGRVRPGDGWGLLCAVRIDPAASGELGSAGMLHWSGAATTHFFVDQKEQIAALLFCQHLPYDQHGLIPRFRTAVLQALR